MNVGIVGEESSSSKKEVKELRKAQNNQLKIDFLKALLLEETIPVQCGRLTGQLHKSLFVCPGIHENCIEYEGKMVSPRKLAIYAELGKQKDWKGSLKVQKKPLRFLFENNLLDFYEHDQMCTGKCIGKSQLNYWQNLTNSDNKQMPGARPSMSSAALPSVSRAKLVKKPASPPVSPGMMHNHLMNLFTQNPAMFWFEAEKTGVLTETIDRLVDSISQLRNAQNPVSKSLLSKVTALFGLQLETVSKVYERIFVAQGVFPSLTGSSHLLYPIQFPPGPAIEFAPQMEESASPQSSPYMKNPNEILAAIAAGMIPPTPQDHTTEEQNVTEQPQPKYSPYF